MSVKVNSIIKFYGDQTALDHVSFSVMKGDVTGFLGPNGAGKSTMMKIISCFIPPSSGSVEVLGYSIDKNPLDIKRNIGYLPEHNPLYMDMYVKEFLLFVCGIYGIKKNGAQARVKQIIEMVGLGDEQHKKIESLSKGYKQRVGLAKALAHDPQVLILDEPTTGLDPNQLAGIRKLIQELGQSKTVILSTHIMQEVEAICSKVIIINKGKIVANDSVSFLKEASASFNHISLKLSAPVDVQQLKTIVGVINVESGATPDSWLLTGNNHSDLRKNITRWAVEQDISIVEMRQASASLEEIFRKVTA